MTRSSESKGCIHPEDTLVRRDSAGARLGVKSSNAMKQVVYLKPEELFYSEVHGGQGHKCSPDRGPFTGHGFNWKKERPANRNGDRSPARQIREYSLERVREKSRFRSPAGTETWDQDEMNATWTFDVGFASGGQWKDHVKADARRAQDRAIATFRDFCAEHPARFHN